MTALWTSAEAAAATGGDSVRDWSASGVSIDSRTLQPGDLFVAIRGPNFDGHDYVQAAMEQDAAAAMIAGATPELGEFPLLRVRDTMAGLQDLASHARARSAAKIAAVTGSAGKTGTKDMLALVLGEQGVTGSTKGNLNNHWGLPLSLARLPRETAYGVFEIGMNSPGEITPLSRLTRPDVAIITNVESVHLEFFDSEEAIADAKAEIFAGMSGDGTAVLNRDNRHFARLRDHAERAGVGSIRSFGSHAEADVRLIEAEIAPDSSTVTIGIDGRELSYVVGAPGAHWVSNSLGVLAVVSALGADVMRAAQALAGVSPAPGRGARRTIHLPAGAFTLVDESYNASPASVRAGLAVLGTATGRRVAVLGDMLELGAQSTGLHAGLARDIAENRIDKVYLAGPMMAHLADALDPATLGAHVGDSEALASLVAQAVRAGDTVMVKGSLGSNMAPVVRALTALDAGAGAATLVASEG